MLIDNHSRAMPSLLPWLLLCGLGCWFSLGCNPSQSTESVACRVLIDGTVARDVRVTLLKIDAGQAIPVFEGSSQPDGLIMLSPVGQFDGSVAALAELVVIVESTGSSEWQLATPWSNPLTTPLKISWPPDKNSVEIQLPRKAVRAI